VPRSSSPIFSVPQPLRPQLSNVPNVQRPQCPTSPISNVPNVQRPQYPTSPISNVPNIQRPQYPTSPISNVPNVQRPQCPTSTMSNVPKCPASLNVLRPLMCPVFSVPRPFKSCGFNTWHTFRITPCTVSESGSRSPIWIVPST